MKVIRTAENLLNDNSLDNTDLTITSLNYIDEQQNGFLSNGRNLHEFFDSKESQKLSVTNK